MGDRGIYSRNSYDDQGPVIIPPQGNAQGAQPPSSGAMGFTFSPQELQVLKECDMESLFQRSLPLGTLCGVGTFMAIKKGYLTVGKWGPGPKCLAASLFGYVLGKLSYQSVCAEKIMRLPNSKLAEALKRRRKGGELFENFGSESALSQFSSTDVYTDENMKSNQQNSLDIDVDRPANFGLDDTYRPNLDQPDRNFDDNLPLEPPKSSVSYEELRRRNREEHDRRMQQPFRSQQAMPSRDEAPIIRRQAPERDDQGLKNKYGDVWK